MNSDRWQDIYKRQPLPTERWAKFDESAFLRELELDDFDAERSWNESDRNRLFSCLVLILSCLSTTVTVGYTWGDVILVLWCAVQAVLTWRHRRSRQQTDYDYGDSLRKRIRRAEDLIVLRRAYRRLDLWSAPLVGLVMGDLSMRLMRLAGGAYPIGLRITLVAGVGLLFTGLIFYWVIIECRKQDQGFQARLDHLHRVKTRLLAEEVDSPASPPSS